MGKGYTPFHTEMAQKQHTLWAAHIKAYPPPPTPPIRGIFSVISALFFFQVGSLPFAVGEKIFEVSFTCKRGIEGVSVLSGLNLEKL